MAVSNKKPQTIDDILQDIRNKADNKAEQGKQFEILTKRFLETEPGYKNQFKKVSLWKDWSKRTTGDIGIDIMCERYDGTYCAVQCKFYDDSNTIQNHDVASFISAISAIEKESNIAISQKIFVHTSGAESSTAIKKLNGIQCTIIDKYKLESANVDWSEYPHSFVSLQKPFTLRQHQQIALKDVIDGFKSNDRGQLIMACGTGKTLTSLHIAQKMYGKGSMILYVVPSISLISQSMRDWSNNCTIPYNFMAVCSDKTVSTDEDSSLSDLECPVSTDPKTLKDHLKLLSKERMNVIFSTYQSIKVVQNVMKGKQFDLILCDEAHRTTGVEGKSYFTTVHNDKNISSKKRLYMTATPKVYSDNVKNNNDNISSMDDDKIYGPTFHRLTFTQAVEQGILCDFRVRILKVSANKVDQEFQKAISEEGEISLDDMSKYAGIWHGLKHPNDKDKDQKLLQRVIAFTNRIKVSKKFAGIEKDDDGVDRSFENAVARYEDKYKSKQSVNVRHMDGKTNSNKRRQDLEWLKDSNQDKDTCRIISNARCLSEGVDVPALDGIVFVNPRKSQIDVIQAVGRVMRKSDSTNKKYGYVIIPVVVPAGIPEHESLDNNKAFKPVWQVLKALRSHDEDLNREISLLALSKDTEITSNITDRIQVLALDSNLQETVLTTEFLQHMESKLVDTVGTRIYVEQFGKLAGEKSRIIKAQIENRINNNKNIKQEIDNFHKDLKELINDSVTFESTVQAISQHLVLAPIFNKLFSDDFITYNPISKAFNDIVDKVGLKEELKELEKFYDIVKQTISGIKEDASRQDCITRIYDNFFKGADPKGSEKHGIVYTPIQIIDFIIHSIQDILVSEFGKDFADNNVKILDPFTGTGSFITRLIRSGYLDSNLTKKYEQDIYANELTLLAYYVATVNIETTFKNRCIGHREIPFEGINYTDTFTHNPKYHTGDSQYTKTQTRLNERFKNSHERIRRQNKLRVDVIMGNPPYSAGQDNFNDNNQNISYPELDKRIDDTYARKTKELDPKNGRIATIHDSYIRSIRWASDRIGKSGVIGFVTNGSFIRTSTTTGIRALLLEEFTDIYCFDLRGNIRLYDKKEGGNVFGNKTQTPITIIILVKNPNNKKHRIHYKDIGDYLTTEQKLDIIEKYITIKNIKDLKNLIHDKHHDWVDQRIIEFEKYTAIGSKDVKLNKNNNTIFKLYSLGVSTNRDAWTYNSSKDTISYNMKKTIAYCNKQDLKNPIMDDKEVSWSSGLDILKKIKPKFSKEKIRMSMYRPFFKQYLYYDEIFNERQYQIPKIFPKENSKNIVIIVPSKYKKEPSVFIVNTTPNNEVVHHGQCFPLYTYENGKKRDNITDYVLKQYQKHYGDTSIDKEDIFYYVYGLLHHEGYKTKYKNNLQKEMPRIPMAPNFNTFVTAGRKLAELHLNYETCEKYPLEPKTKFGKLKKMTFGKMDKDGKRVTDELKLIINGIEVFDLPKTKYIVNGRSPIKWMISQYKVKFDENSGIVNDSTKYMTEEKTISMIQRLTYVATESDKIISEISKLEFEPDNWTPESPDSSLDKFSSVSKDSVIVYKKIEGGGEP